MILNNSFLTTLTCLISLLFTERLSGQGFEFTYGEKVPIEWGYYNEFESFAVSENWAAVGMPFTFHPDFKNYGVNNDSSEYGAVWVYGKLENGDWTKVDTLYPPDDVKKSRFGSNVHLTDSSLYVLLGTSYSPQVDSLKVKIYVYKLLDSGKWVFSNTINSYNPYEEFKNTREGGSGINGVNKSNLVGTQRFPHPYDPVELVIYENHDSVIVQSQTFRHPDDDYASFFGRNVSLSDSIIVVSDTRDRNFRGAVYVYRLHLDGIWRYDQKLTPNSGRFFGSVIDVDAGNIVVASTSNTPPLGGKVWIFEDQGVSNWVLKKEFEAHVSGSLEFGQSVSISGDNLLVLSNSGEVSENTPTYKDHNSYVEHYQLRPSGLWELTSFITPIDEKEFGEWGGNPDRIFLCGNSLIYYDGANWEYTLSVTNSEVLLGKLNLLELRDGIVGLNLVSSRDVHLEISPNPSTDVINLNYELEGYHTLKILNSEGLIMYEIDDLSTIESINLDNYPSGLYVISLFSDTDIISERFVVE